MSALKQHFVSLLATPINLLALVVRLLKSGPLAPIMLGVFLLSAVMVGLWLNGSLTQTRLMLVNNMHQQFANLGLQLKGVSVTGRHNTRQQDIIDAFDTPLGTPIFAVDLDAAQARLEMLAWVKSASITRILPDRFHIELVEREPFALWRQDEHLYLIDRDGVKITRNYLTRFHHLPTMEGEKSHLYAAQFMDLLTAYPVLRNRMVGARRYGDRRWTVYLDHGGAVHLPAENVEKALKLLMDMEKEKRVLALHGRAIDLRMEDRVLLRALPLPANKKKTEKAT